MAFIAKTTREKPLSVDFPYSADAPSQFTTLALVERT